MVIWRMPELIVIGLDGANWDLINPWLQEEKLPNIKQLRENGVSSDMLSCLPPVSCPNWRCYSTGKNPGKLGVYWWEMIDKENRTMSIPDSRSFKSSNFWDYLNDAGISTGIMNLPMTYPLFDVDGFMIAGGPGSEDAEEYAHPPSLETELRKSDYQLHPENSLSSNDDYKTGAEVVDLIDQRMEWFRNILQQYPVDVAHCTVFYVNNLQHYFWRDRPVRNAWEVIDAHIGSLRETFPDANLLLMSDHGCNAIDTIFSINAWLESEGYLVTNDGTTSQLPQAGITQQQLMEQLKRLGVYRMVPSELASFVRSFIPQDEEGFTREKKFQMVDWKQSKAIASGQGLVYTLVDDEAVREEIIAGLEELTRASGEPVAKEVYKGENVYEGPYIDSGPDIVFEQAPGLHTSGSVGASEIFPDVSHWDAENDRVGLFLATGPDISCSDISGPMSITDLAPTILDLMDTPVPMDVDGDSLQLSDTDDPEFRSPIVPEFVSGTLGDDTRTRLEDLGYL